MFIIINMNDSLMAYNLIILVEKINEYSLIELKNKLYEYSENIRLNVSPKIYKKFKFDLETINIECLYGYGDFTNNIKIEIENTLNEIINDMSKIKIFKDIKYV